MENGNCIVMDSMRLTDRYLQKIYKRITEEVVWPKEMIPSYLDLSFECKFMKLKQKKSIAVKSDADYADFDVTSDNEEGVDVLEKFSTDDVRPNYLPNLDVLQLACETLAARARRHQFQLRCLIQGKSAPAWCSHATGTSNGLDACSNSSDSCIIPNSSSSSAGSLYTTISERVAKTVPGKPLTLIISQRVRKSGSDEDEKPPIKRLRLSSNADSTASSSQEVIANGWSTGTNDSRRSSSSQANTTKLLRKGTQSSSSIQTRNSRPENLPEGKEIPVANKNLYDIPNKFWALMEPYCADLNDDNFRSLEGMMKRYEDDSNLYKVPSLGDDNSSTRRSIKLEHLGTEIKIEPKSKSAHENDLTALLKRVDSEIRKPVGEPSQLSSVAQHMVSNLIEQNIMQPMCAILEANETENVIDEPGTSNERRFALSTKSLARQLKVSNSFKLEKKIKKFLEKLGHFPLTTRSEEEDEGLDDDPTDEILSLLRRKQREFRLLSEYNRSVLRRVSQCVRRDLQRQEILRRLAVADADVIEAYNKIISYRQKNKAPIKRDRDLAWKTLRERKKLLKELEEFNQNS